MSNLKKYLVCLVLSVFMLGTLSGCSDETTKALSIDSKSLTMDIEEQKSIQIKVEPENINLSETDFIIKDDSIVNIESIKDNVLTIKTLKAEGSTTLYCNRDDIKSNEITIQVIDQEKLALNKAEEEKKAAEQKAAEAKKSQEETTQKPATSSSSTSSKNTTSSSTSTSSKNTTSSSSTTSKNTTSSSSTKPTGQNVYVTKSGEKYHAIPKCGNTKSSTLVSLNEAKSSGLTACSKCY